MSWKSGGTSMRMPKVWVGDQRFFLRFISTWKRSGMVISPKLKF
jgi:hypothetical protein